MLIVLLVVVLGPALVLGSLAGAGPAALVGAFIAFVAVLGSAGGALWPDLRRLAGTAPLLAFAAVVPRLLSEVSRPGAFALITALVVVAALLPLLGPRFASTGLGLGLLTLLAYSLPLNGSVDAWQLVIAAAVGLAEAFVLRLAMGIGDPTLATRTAVAAVFDADEPALTDAFDLWLADGRRRWLGQALIAGAGYQFLLGSIGAFARQLPEPQRAFTAKAEQRLWVRASAVADLVRVKDAPGQEADGEKVEGKDADSLEDAADLLPAQVCALLTEADESLGRAEHAARQRDPAKFPVGEDTIRLLRPQLMSTGLRLRSVQVRHALRTGLGVLIALMISLSLKQGDPLMPTLLMTTFGVLQAGWRETLAKARLRLVGLVLGVVVVIAILLLAPTEAMTYIAIVAVVVGLWNLQARPVIGYAGLMCMSVGINSSLRDLDPTTILVEYAALTVVALLIGVVVGFVVIPGVRRPPLAERIQAAILATARSMRSFLGQDAMGTNTDRSTMLALQREAVLARRELVPDHDELSDEQAAELDQLRLGLKDLIALSVLAAADQDADPRAIEPAIDRLAAITGPHPRAGGGAVPDSDAVLVGGPTNGALLALADQVAANHTALLRTRPFVPDAHG